MPGVDKDQAINDMLGAQMLNKHQMAAKCVEAQKKYCKDNNQPHFAPHDGYCFYCRANIYYNGWDLKRASTELITGCPHCHRSFCD